MTLFVVCYRDQLALFAIITRHQLGNVYTDLFGPGARLTTKSNLSNGSSN